MSKKKLDLSNNDGTSGVLINYDKELSFYPTKANVEQLYINGFMPIPIVKGQKGPPTISGWSAFSNERPSLKETLGFFAKLKEGHFNLAVVAGEACNLTIVDVDTDDERVLKTLPQSTVSRFGSKGACRFFKYNENLKKKKYAWGELLNNGSYCVIPPSLHPDTQQNYRWIGANSLFVSDYLELPELDHTKLEVDYESLVKRYLLMDRKIKAVPKGRNDKYVLIISAMLFRGCIKEEIIDELLKEDDKIPNPLFLDFSEAIGRHTDSAYKNAEIMVNNVRKTIENIPEEKLIEEYKIPVESIKFVKPETTVASEIITQDLALEKIEILPSLPIEHSLFSPVDYPEATGLLKDLCVLCDAYSFRKNGDFSLGAALSLAGLLASNRLTFEGVHPCLYTLIVGPTGSGKDAPRQFIERVTDKIKYGSYVKGDMASHIALTENLRAERIRMLLIDEVASLFDTMNGQANYQRNLLHELNKLWSASQGQFKKSSAFSRKDTGSCHSPQMNLLGMTTGASLEKAGGSSFISSGLFPRSFIYYKDLVSDRLKDKEKRSKKAIKELEKSVLTRLASCFSVAPISVEMEGSEEEGIGKIYAQKELKRGYDDFEEEEIEQWIEALRDELDAVFRDEAAPQLLKDLSTRFEQQLKKVAICLAFLDGRSHISLTDLKWGRQLVQACFTKSRQLIELINFDSPESKLRTKILHFLKTKPEGATQRDLLRKFSIGLDPFLKATYTLIASQEIERMPLEVSGKRGREGFLFKLL